MYEKHDTAFAEFGNSFKIKEVKSSHSTGMVHFLMNNSK
jgi:hypothetical protein